MNAKKWLESFHWWVVKIKAQQESKAEKKLSPQGFITFCSIFNIEIKRGNQIQIKPQPLFTGY